MLLWLSLIFFFFFYLDQDSGHLALDGLKVEAAVVTNDNLDVEGLGTGLDTGNGLRVAVFVDKEGALLAVGGGPAHQHGLGSSSAFVQKRSVGDGHAGEIGDHGLVVEERLETALGNLGLVGGVLGVPIEYRKQQHWMLECASHVMCACTPLVLPENELPQVLPFSFSYLLLRSFYCPLSLSLVHSLLPSRTAGIRFSRV